MRLWAAAIDAPATTKIRRLGVNRDVRDHHELGIGDCADSSDSAISGFWDGVIALNLAVN